MKRIFLATTLAVLTLSQLTEAKMKENIILSWNYLNIEQFGEQIVYLSYDVIDGFRDIDFHQIKTSGHWKNLEAKTDSAVAVLEFAEKLTLEQVSKAIREVQKNGKYKQIKIKIK